MLTKLLAGNSGDSPIIDCPYRQRFFIEVKLAGMGRIALSTRNLAAESDVSSWNLFQIVAEIFCPHIGCLQRQHIRFPHCLDCGLPREARHYRTVNKRWCAFGYRDMDFRPV